MGLKKLGKYQIMYYSNKSTANNLLYYWQNRNRITDAVLKASSRPYFHDSDFKSILNSVIYSFSTRVGFKSLSFMIWTQIFVTQTQTKQTQLHH